MRNTFRPSLIAFTPAARPSIASTLEIDQQIPATAHTLAKPGSMKKNAAWADMLAKEPEDARITGATRSLYRRLTALNLHIPVQTVRLGSYSETTLDAAHFPATKTA